MTTSPTGLTKDSTPAEARAALVAELRSGRRTQGTDFLRAVPLDAPQGTPWQECCLGVACDLAARAGLGQWFDDPNRSHGEDIHGNEVTVSRFTVKASDLSWDEYPPIAVMDMFGLSGNAGDLLHPIPYYDADHTGWREARSLAELNDLAGFDFDMIATVIELGYVATAEEEGE